MSLACPDFSVRTPASFQVRRVIPNSKPLRELPVIRPQCVDSRVNRDQGGHDTGLRRGPI